MISIAVRGKPVTQGSKSTHAARRKTAQGGWEYTGKVAVTEGKDKDAQERHRAWREAVKQAAVDAMHAPVYPLEGPLVVSMVFGFQRPKGHYRTGRNSHLLKDAAPGYPDVKPDVGKLARCVEDALKDAGVYGDDAQVVCYRPLMKLYTDHQAAPPFPGVLIRIRHMPQRVPGLVALPEADEDEQRAAAL